MAKRLVNKKAKKKLEGKCYFCPEDDYNLLDCHRIFPGEKGGTYEDRNILVTCANCHRKIHSGKVIIDRKYLSTSGKWVLHYWVNGEEKWL
jgi:hypothetical protein